MTDLNPEDMEALFPAQCHIKVIARDLTGVHAQLNTTLLDLGLEGVAFQPSATSKNGKYISFEISLHVETHARMREIDTALRAVEGVKLVL